jgi:hypothetical protein
MALWISAFVASLEEPFENIYRISELLGVDARIHRARCRD